MTRATVIAAALVSILPVLVTTAAEPETFKVPANSSEPTKCYRLLANSGLELTIGITLEACGGSLDGAKTVACLIEAWSSREMGGLSLTIGQGIDLCRVGGNRQG